MVDKNYYFHVDTKNKNQLILFHKFKPIYLKINKTTADIIDCYHKNPDIDFVARKISADYLVNFDEAKTDVIKTITSLRNAGFLDNERKLKPRIPKLKSLFLHITDHCNLACAQCYLSASQKKNNYLSFTAIKKLIDELVRLGGNSVTLSGGEPLLHPEIKKIIKYAHLKVQVQILTNGTVIDEKWADFLNDKNCQIQISLDGSNGKIHDAIRGKGSFEKVIHAVQCLQNAGLGNKLNFSTTIMPQNYRDLKNLIRLSEKLGVSYHRFLPLRNVGRAEKLGQHKKNVTINDYTRFFKYVMNLNETKQTNIDISCGLSGLIFNVPENDLRDYHWCSIGKKIVVDADGETYPCATLMEKQFRLGNSYSHSLAEIIDSKKMKSYSDLLLNRRDTITGCSHCHFRNLCQSSCMGQAFSHTGSILKKDYFCGFRKKEYETAFKKILSNFGC